MARKRNQFDVCVICALPEETQALLKALQLHFLSIIEEDTSPRYKYAYRIAGIKNKKDELLTLHVSWLPRYGPQEMTLHLSHVLEEYQPRIAMMTGICAGDVQQVQLGDLVVAERTFTYDNGKFARDEQGRSVHEYDTMTYQLDGNILQFLKLFDEWQSLVACLELPSGRPQDQKVTCHIKPMASGNAVRADHPFEDVRAPVRGTVAIDMECAAFGLVADRHRSIPWLVVKGVCDYADQGKNNVYHHYAACASALYALSFIRAYVTVETTPANRAQHCSPSHVFSKMLADGKGDRRLKGARELVTLKDPCTAPVIISRLQVEPEPYIRYWLAYALGLISCELAFNAQGRTTLLRALQDAKETEEDPFARRGIDEALQLIQNCGQHATAERGKR